MDTQPLHTALIIGTTAIVTSILNQLWTWRKRSKETTRVEVETETATLKNVQTTIQIYKDAADELLKEVNGLRCQVANMQKELKAVREENKELKKLIEQMSQQETCKWEPAKTSEG